MIKYPMSFKVNASSPSGIERPWQTWRHGIDPKIPIAIPPEFEGPGSGFSPEDLYAMALTNCFIATFKVFAEKSKLEFNSIDIDADLSVDRNEKGHPWMASIRLKVILDGVSEKDKAMRLLNKVSESCLIINSVNTEKTFEFDVRVR